MAATYVGAAALGLSKYASPEAQRVALVPRPFAVHSYDSTIATKEQIAAVQDKHAERVSQDTDAQLSIAQGRALKADVDKCVTKLSNTISTAVVNTRQLLMLIHESLQKDSVKGTGTVDQLWLELEQLIAAACEAKAAIPAFLDKQRNSMSLYHATVMNETIRDSQEEVNIQHKKIGIQHSLILEHQEAFQDYKAQTATKLREFEDLQERVSRLTLEKGNFRGEVDTYKQLLEKERELKAGELEKLNALQKELGILLASKTQLLDEADGFRKTIQQLEEQMQHAEQRITKQLSTEFKAKLDDITKDTQETKTLRSLLDSHKADKQMMQMQAEKLREENKEAKDKYSQQSAEHAQAFSNLREQAKKIESLVIDMGRLREENRDLKQRALMSSDFEKLNADLAQAKSALAAQILKLSADVDAAKKDGTRAKLDRDGLKEELVQLEQTIANLKAENSNLLLEYKDYANAMHELHMLRSENERLNSVVKELQDTGTVAAVDGCLSSDKDGNDLHEKVKGLEKQKVDLEIALEEWTDLAKRSYQQYKEMLPMYKQTEQYRKDSLDKDDTIKKLKGMLSAAKMSQSSGVGAEADNDYWKEKYEVLLAQFNS